MTAELKLVKDGGSAPKKQKEKRSLRAILYELLENGTDDDENPKLSIALELINKAKSGDIRAIEALARFIGERPSQYKEEHTDAEIRADKLNFF